MICCVLLKGVLHIRGKYSLIPNIMMFKNNNRFNLPAGFVFKIDIIVMLSLQGKNDRNVNSIINILVAVYMS